MLKRFGDVIVDPDKVFCVSRKMAKLTEESTAIGKSSHSSGGSEESANNDEKTRSTTTDDKSTMLIRNEGAYFQVEISESAADNLLDFLDRKNRSTDE